MICEQNLQLVITDKSLGSLTTNALQIKAMVEAALPDYSIENYADDLELAKADKAMLNKAKKALNDERIKIEREFMKPFDEFKTIVTDTCKLIDACATKIDSVVKEADEIERTKKRALIESLWTKRNFTLVPLVKVFEDKWLLKGTKEKDIDFRMDEIVLSIESDIKTIEAIGDDVDTLKAMYLENLNLNETIQYSRRLKDNRERIAAEEARRAAYVPPTPKPEPPPAPAPELVYIDPPAPPAPVSAPPVADIYSIVSTFRITGFRDEIDAVAAFMDANGIDYEEI